MPPIRAQPRPAASGAGEPDPQRLPARLRPHHPFDRLPPARPQDPGVRLPRGRPFPHPPHPYAGGRPDRPLAGRALGLDEDLAEALALAHDLGHPPFGHAGERALDRCLAAHGGFDHNAQTLRVVTALERRYAAFDGLNLTWETLEGLVKHNGPLTDRDGEPVGRYAERGVPQAIRSTARRQDLELWSFASAEAQVAAIADDIAYDAHDIDDGLRAELFALDDLADVALAGDILREIARALSGAGGGQGGATSWSAA